jgi:hypothetical protein
MSKLNTYAEEIIIISCIMNECGLPVVNLIVGNGLPVLCMCVECVPCVILINRMADSFLCREYIKLVNRGM